MAGPKHVRRLAEAAVLFILVALWAGWLRPPVLGGRTSYVMVNGVSMQPTMRYGDLAIVQKNATYKVGDIVAYRIPKGQPAAGYMVIHRIVGGSATRGFVTRGDNPQNRDDLWRPKASDVVGHVWIHVPGTGRLFQQLRTPIPLGIVAGFLATWVTLGLLPKKKEKAEPVVAAS